MTVNTMPVRRIELRGQPAEMLADAEVASCHLHTSSPGGYSLLLGILTIAFLDYATPNLKQPRFRWMSLGSAIALVIFLLASAAFAFYAANFSSDNKTDGAIAGVIISLLLLWILNMSLLFGPTSTPRRRSAANCRPESTPRRPSSCRPERRNKATCCRPRLKKTSGPAENCPSSTGMNMTAKHATTLRRHL